MRQMVFAIGFVFLCGCTSERFIDRTAQPSQVGQVTPEQFGAVGDRIHNDTVALQQAIAIKQPVDGEVMINSTRYIDCNNQVVADKE